MIYDLIQNYSVGILNVLMTPKSWMNEANMDRLSEISSCLEASFSSFVKIKTYSGKKKSSMLHFLALPNS